jgi:hypothetical protein
MLDTTPISTELARLITLGTTEHVALNAAKVPRADIGRVVCGPPGRNRSGGEAGGAEALMGT